MLQWLAALVLFGLPAEPVRPILDRKALDDAKEQLRSRRTVERVAALRALVSIDTKESWRLVAGALGDPAGEVGEAAEVALGKAGSTHALEALSGRSGLSSSDDEVVRRACLAFGRSDFELPPRAFGSALRSHDPDVQACALWAFEEAVRSRRWFGPSMEAWLAKRVQRGATDIVRGQALACLLALDGEWGGRAVSEALRCKRRGLRTAAMSLAASLDPGEARAAVLGGLEDEAWSVRMAALNRASGVADTTVMRAVLERLTSDSRPRLRERALQVLRSVSGLRHGPDPRPWSNWLERWDGVASGSGSEPHRVSGRADERTIAMERVLIRSDHVAFLIDLSGSMWAEREGGKSRKEIVDVQFGELLERLDPETSFCLIPYARSPFPWRDEPVPAKKRNVAQARSYFEGCRERGAGDFWEAALLALEQETIDTIVVLTDGVPTGGDYNRMDLLVERFLQENRTRQVTLEAILIEAPGGAVRHWTSFVEQTGGRCVPVTLQG